MEKFDSIFSTAASSEAAQSPEILRECLLILMNDANHGSAAAQEAVLDQVRASDGRAAGFVCKKADCRLGVEKGTVRGAYNCALVQAGAIEVPTSLQ